MAMTMREINQLLEAVFEFNREAVKHTASVEFSANPKDGGVVWLYVFNLNSDGLADDVKLNVAIRSGKDSLEACKKMADVIAEEKSSAA